MAKTAEVITDKRLQQMADALVHLPGIHAVTLGGSRARGTHHDTSDVDLGLYHQSEDLDIDALTRTAAAFNDTGRIDIAGPGGWGPWVNGGGWLTVDQTPVDWILRDLDRVHHQCQRAITGDFAFHTQPGHPLGFLDISYAGEVATCIPLADPTGVLTDLRASLDPYPPALRTSFIDNLWQAEFLLKAARKGLPKHDSTYITLCCSTAIMICAHAWHAAAGSWPTNEKGLVVDVARLPLDTHDFSTRAAAILDPAEHHDTTLATMIDHVTDLVNDTHTTLNPQR